MTTDAAPSGWGSTLEKEQEMIAMAHGTWNRRQAKLNSNNREIKAITQGLRSFAKTLKNLRIQSLAIRSDNSTAAFNSLYNVEPHPLDATSVVIVIYAGICINCAEIFALNLAIHHFINIELLSLSLSSLQSTLSILQIMLSYGQLCL
ncbi:MAG: hypothetical protein EZS28_043940 [Streblomastix strix]|uniref:Uncharacterized protein n=1 Tax=Streblomastix strix TaxID=222440 RepID=A0A5J4TQ10_9EUKA|nr:MAG: hypothetical protein EZS28_043940 [Streblomastix strix]